MTRCFRQIRCNGMTVRGVTSSSLKRQSNLASTGPEEPSSPGFSGKPRSLRVGMNPLGPPYSFEFVLLLVCAAFYYLSVF